MVQIKCYLKQLPKQLKPSKDAASTDQKKKKVQKSRTHAFGAESDDDEDCNLSDNDEEKNQ